MCAQIVLNVASEWTENEKTLNVGPPIDEIDYLPCGVRTLKILVEGSKSGTVIIHPQAMDPLPGRILGYADGPAGRDIEISWGGGWEKGVILNRKSNDKQYIFFNLLHQGGDAAADYTLTLLAEDDHGNLLGQRQIKLARPTLPDCYLQPTWAATAPGVERLSLLPALPGQPPRTPIYLSRWWPWARVNYVSPQITGPVPEIWLDCERNTGQSNSRVTIWASPASSGAPKKLAIIGGDLQFPVIDLHQVQVSLYFFAGCWVLRVFFFWLDKNVLELLAGKPLTSAEQAAVADWATDQEIPDAERFDLVFNQQLKVQYVCSDLHWHEMWGKPGSSKLLDISIAGTKASQVVIRGGAGISVIAAARAKDYIPDPNRQFNPADKVREQLKDSSKAPLGAGSLLHKHTPYFKGIEYDPDLISSDVLKV